MDCYKKLRELKSPRRIIGVIGEDWGGNPTEKNMSKIEEELNKQKISFACTSDGKLIEIYTENEQGDKAKGIVKEMGLGKYLVG